MQKFEAITKRVETLSAGTVKILVDNDHIMGTLGVCFQDPQAGCHPPAGKEFAIELKENEHTINKAVMIEEP